MAETSRLLTLPEGDAQAVALVRAFEETDRAGELLPVAARRAATAVARGATRGATREGSPDGAAWLAVRARELAGRLRQDLRFLPRLLRFTHPVRGLLPWALALAFAIGLLTNALGPSQRINVLAVPLAGLIVWNLAVLALTVARAALPLDLGSGAPRFVGTLESMARRLVDRLPRHGRDDEEQGHPGGGPTEHLLRRALGRYLADWLPAATPAAAARGRRLLHASSLAMISGVVAGMYARGVLFQYHATWESTFLGAGAIDVFLGAVLAPASALLGVEVPSAVAIESPRYGDAAPWIHLWAMTAAIFVGVPRLLLAAAAHLRCERRRRRVELPVPEAYVRRLLASAGASERLLEVLPFSYRPRADAAEALKSLLYDLFGPRSQIRLRPALDYGTEPADLEPGEGRVRLVLFSLAQTPEVEVHGELLRRLCDELPDGQALVAAVDASAYRRRLAGGDRSGERLAERRRAWDRVVRDAVAPEGRQRNTLDTVHLDLGEPADDEVLNRILAAAWPSGVLAAEA